MSKKEWPLWFNITYCPEVDPMYKNYTACANDAKMLIDMLERTKIKVNEIICFKADEKVLNEKEITGLFELVDKVRKEKMENEKRKETEQKAKNANKRSGAKS